MDQIILCEGTRTEVHYLESLLQELPPSSGTGWYLKGVGYNTLALLQVAQKMLEARAREERPPCRIWLVFDKDSYPDDHFNRTILACSRNPQLEAIWTNEAFELWFLLHFGLYDMQLGRHQYRERLESAVHQAGYKSFRYQKEKADIVSVLKEYGQENMALKRAKMLHDQWVSESSFARRNPCTMVYKLVNAIRSTATPFLL